jgi:hypothetical protein
MCVEKALRRGPYVRFKVHLNRFIRCAEKTASKGTICEF